jgi:hypothetical protein
MSCDRGSHNKLSAGVGQRRLSSRVLDEEAAVPNEAGCSSACKGRSRRSVYLMSVAERIGFVAQPPAFPDRSSFESKMADAKVANPSIIRFSSTSNFFSVLCAATQRVPTNLRRRAKGTNKTL